MTPQLYSAIDLSASARARMTRWCRQRAAASRILQKAAWLQALQKKTELKLIGVARASLEELLLDYHDFLRQKGLLLWEKNHPMAQTIRKLAWEENRSYTTYKTYIEEKNPEVAANTLICLIHQANYLLDQQLRQLGKQFLEEGGFTEKLYQARQQVRRK